ncbi:MAG: hypothetical protein KBT69_11060 [Oceanihabitans sp.]|nr:hypothetical protein [Oceanihabitans sp.]
MFQDLKDVATDEEKPDLSIVCIAFIYPLTIFVFNETNAYVATSVLEDHTQFSTFLEVIVLVFVFLL